MNLKIRLKIFFVSLCCLGLFGCGRGFSSAFAVKLSNPRRYDVQATEKLFKAVEECDVNGVELALSEGADVNARNDGSTPLLNVAASIPGMKVDVVLTLLAQKGIKVNAADFFGNTALHSAIVNGNIDAVQVLLMDSRTNVNAYGWRSRTPLVLALVKEKKAIAQKILGRNDVNVLDSCFGGCVALDIAQKKGYDDIARTIGIKRWLQLNSAY